MTDRTAIEARAAEAERLSKDATPEQRMMREDRYEHGGGRKFVDGESGERILVLDVYEIGDREFYFRCRAMVPALAADVRALLAEVAERDAENERLKADVSLLRKMMVADGRFIQQQETELAAAKDDARLWERLCGGPTYYVESGDIDIEITECDTGWQVDYHGSLPDAILTATYPSHLDALRAIEAWEAEQKGAGT